MVTKSSKTSSKSVGFSAKPQPQSAPADTSALEVTIAELQTKLTDAENQKSQLQSSITELEAKLAAQANTLEDLQTQLQSAPQLQSALSKAEAAARQLAELNETLMEENQTLKAAATVAESPTTTALAAPRRAHSNLVHPVFPDNATIGGGLKEQEIGWFD